jgi:hypothetical protein
LADDLRDCGELLDRFVFFEVDDPMRIAWARWSLTGWISTGIEARFFSIRISHSGTAGFGSGANEGSLLFDASNVRGFTSSSSAGI